MKSVSVSYDQWKSLVASKGLLPQYVENTTNYDLFAVEANVSWEVSIMRDGGSEVTDFETNHKASCNMPLEYRSIDGLPKVASAKFADTLSLILDGQGMSLSLNSGETKYVKKHYSAPYTLSGVDAYWSEANWGDYIDFEVGVYTDESDETTFVSLNKFANNYSIFGSGNRLFDVPAVKILPPTVQIAPGVNANTYIRAKCVNVGSGASKIILNLVGWM